MPICRPEQPRFGSGAERQVWDRLKAQLRPDDILLAGIRVSDRTKDHEADLVVLMPGAGIVVVEVKGGSVWRAHGEWFQARAGGSGKQIDPVEQARGCRYALRAYVESDSRWYVHGRRRARWAHAVVLPNCTLPEDFAAPDCPRWMVADRGDLNDLAGILRGIVERQVTTLHLLTTDDAAAVLDILAGRGEAQREVIADADERAVEARRLTQEQAAVLDAIRLLNRVEVRGGAGSGKTWLAVEQARRLTREGSRVAVLCYSRGLAAYLRRYVATLPEGETPAYVGEFHGLGLAWGAATGHDDSDYWENSLPAEMRDLAAALPADQRFDAVIIDEAQDFADTWWLAVLASLKDEETGGLYAFSDEGQRVFARFGHPPVPLIPIMLDHNLRNSRQIAETFSPLTPIPMRLLGGEGPAVRFVDCATDKAMAAGDDAVDALLDEGWRPEDIALLTTGSRHNEQVQRQGLGQGHYWDTFWDPDQVFYGHVLGFKGLERRAIVLVLNEATVSDRSRERLYVGLSRARDQLIVCGNAAAIRELGGDDVLRVLRAGLQRGKC